MRDRRGNARRPRAALVALVLLIGVVAMGADKCTEYHEGGYAGDMVFTGYQADESSFTVDFPAGHDGWVGESISGGNRHRHVDNVSYAWSDDGVLHDATDSPGLIWDRAWVTIRGSVSVPTRAAGGTLRIRLQSLRDCDSPPNTICVYYTWTRPVSIPAPSAHAEVFALADPPGEEGTLLDARGSWGKAPLTYTWSPAACDNPTGLDGRPLPEGMTRVSGRVDACRVAVADSRWPRSRDAATIAIGSSTEPGLHNGRLEFAGETVTIVAPTGLSDGHVAGTACLDLTGGSDYAMAVSLTGPADPTHRLANLRPGRHLVSAVIWKAGTNDECAYTGDDRSRSGFVQRLRSYYDVSAAGAAGEARRLGVRRAKAYRSSSRVRFTTTRTIKAGRTDKAGVLRGAITVGTYTWRTKARAGGTTRPRGLASLARGTYVSKTTQLALGPPKGLRTTITSVSTVLLRGADGTLACLRSSYGFGAGSLALLGGTGSARRLTLATRDRPILYRLPASTSKMTTIRTTTSTGVVTAASRGGHRLPRACRSLARYLP